LIDPDLQSQYRSGGGGTGYLFKILSRQNALVFWRFLPQAMKIAQRRCGLNTPGYLTILAEYFSLCGQFTHFVGQIKVQQENISKRNYSEAQKTSWLAYQAGPDRKNSGVTA